MWYQTTNLEEEQPGRKSIDMRVTRRELIKVKTKLVGGLILQYGNSLPNKEGGTFLRIKWG